MTTQIIVKYINDLQHVFDSFQILLISDNRKISGNCHKNGKEYVVDFNISKDCRIRFCKITYDPIRDEYTYKEYEYDFKYDGSSFEIIDVSSFENKEHLVLHEIGEKIAGLIISNIIYKSSSYYHID